MAIIINKHKHEVINHDSLNLYMITLWKEETRNPEGFWLTMDDPGLDKQLSVEA